jgi:exodeoxyribonuclease VII small subunit
MTKTQTPAEHAEQTFESAMKRLEQIVEAMESDQLPLEDLIVRYEEGIRLVQVCETKLKTAEKKIEVITRKAQGKPELTPFEPEQHANEKNPGSATGEASLF